MKKIGYLLLLVILLAVASVVFKQHNPQQQVDIPNAEQSKNDISDWPLYENTKLGIALRYPKQIGGSDVVFFQVSNIVVVTTASSSVYIHRDEFSQLDDNAVLKKIADIGGQDTTGPVNKFWAIQVLDARSDTDLNAIIQKWFGGSNGFSDRCTLGEKTKTSQEDVYSVSIAPVNKNKDDDMLSSCPITTRIGFKYSPQYQRAAIWKIGQEGQFLLCHENLEKCDGDSAMADSFTFIDKK